MVQCAKVDGSSELKYSLIFHFIKVSPWLLRMCNWRLSENCQFGWSCMGLCINHRHKTLGDVIGSTMALRIILCRPQKFGLGLFLGKSASVGVKV